MKTKDDFEEWYKKENPWNFNNSITDHVRRKIFISHIDAVFSNTIIEGILDAGCGEGYLTSDIALKYGVYIDAFDISDNAIHYAKERNGLDTIHYYHQDLNDFQPTRKYDLIICEESLYYLNDVERRQAIKKFHASLRNDSYLKLSVVTIGENQYRKYFTLDKIKSLLTDNGFKIISILPSVINNKYFIHKIMFRIFAIVFYLIKAKILIEVLERITMQYPLEKCYQVSILAKKV